MHCTNPQFTLLFCEYIPRAERHVYGSWRCRWIVCRDGAVVHVYNRVFLHDASHARPRLPSPARAARPAQPRAAPHPGGLPRRHSAGRCWFGACAAAQRRHGTEYVVFLHTAPCLAQSSYLYVIPSLCFYFLFYLWQRRRLMRLPSMSVCLSVSKITLKCVHGFGWHFACRQMSGRGRTVQILSAIQMIVRMLEPDCFLWYCMRCNHGTLLCRENPTYRYGAAAMPGFKMVFVGGTCALPSALLVHSFIHSCSVSCNLLPSCMVLLIVFAYCSAYLILLTCILIYHFHSPRLSFS